MAMQKLAGEGKRRKAIIVLTDGVDTAVRDKDRILSKTSKKMKFQLPSNPKPAKFSIGF